MASEQAWAHCCLVLLRERQSLGECVAPAQVFATTQASFAAVGVAGAAVAVAVAAQAVLLVTNMGSVDAIQPDSLEHSAAK